MVMTSVYSIADILKGGLLLKLSFKGWLLYRVSQLVPVLDIVSLPIIMTYLNYKSQTMSMAKIFGKTKDDDVMA